MEEAQMNASYYKIDENQPVDPDTLPNISILTPTYNRSKFIPLMIDNILSFTYPKEKLEWVIYDDHPEFPLFECAEEIQQIRQIIAPVKLNYKYDCSRHLSIGEKRNKLVKLAKYKIVANMDDDDIYLPEYLLYSIMVMKKAKAGLVGSPQMMFIYPQHEYKMSFINCGAKRQAHEATMVFTKKYFKSIGGFAKSSRGEGAGIIDYNDTNVACSEIKHVMICVCHKGIDCNDNTCDKDLFLQHDIPVRLDKEDKKLLILKKIFS